LRRPLLDGIDNDDVIAGGGDALGEDNSLVG